MGLIEGAGNRFIDRIEAEASSSPTFRHLLGTYWKAAPKRYGPELKRVEIIGDVPVHQHSFNVCKEWLSANSWNMELSFVELFRATKLSLIP
jgi:hypothetical protein